MRKIIIIISTLLIIVLSGCSTGKVVRIDSSCIGQEEYNNLNYAKPKDVEDRLYMASDCEIYCKEKNMSCYSYEKKGCNILADDTIFKCLTKDNEMRIFII